VTALDGLLAADATTGRCPESVRSDRGYSRCHLPDNGHQLHHVTGRSWTGRQGNGTIRLRFTSECDPGCAAELVTLWGARIVSGTPRQEAARQRIPLPEFTALRSPA
jgi:hypothetical protein